MAFNLLALFEKEFGRLFSPMEIQIFNEWKSNYDDEQILKALKIAVMKEARSFRYIDAVLKKMKPKVKEEVKQPKNKKSKNKEITIYANGSCNPYTRLGSYKTLLMHGNNQYKVLNDTLSDVTVNRCILTGIIEAIKLLKEPCKITINTATAFGVMKAKRGKGVNSDLNGELLKLIEDGKHKVKFQVIEGGGKMVDSFIKEHMTEKPKKPQPKANYGNIEFTKIKLNKE